MQQVATLGRLNFKNCRFYEEIFVEIACLDLEGVLVPEIWIAFAEKAGIESLRATSTDIPDYDVLMK